MRKLTSRERFLLVAVLSIGAGALFYGRGGGLGGGAMGGAEPDPLALGLAPQVELARLSFEPEPFDSKARNLFSYFTPPPVVRKGAATRSGAERKAIIKKAPPPVARVQARPAASREAPAPKPACLYIGHMGQKDQMMAVLECGDEVVLAAAGETVEKQFKVLRFKYEMLVLGYTSERWADKTTELPMKR